jgi:DNA-binding transcriptional MerR regulator
MADRSHLSIGEVLSLLQDEFPEVTISKIRFLESQGLLDPERTPSGYRKFYEDDIARLRWILLQQREHFLPLKVIKDRLDEANRAGDVVPADHPGPPVADDAAIPLAPTASATPDAPASPPVSAAAPPEAPAAAARQPVAPRPPAPPERRASVLVGAVPAASTDNPLDPGPSGISLTLDELSDAAGLSRAELDELARFGLLQGRTVGADTFYDGDALVVARTAAGFLRHGVEARHLRMYKVSAEREAGFYEQVVMPLLKQRNPDARRRAAQTLGELAHLGDQMRTAMLRGALREHTELR